MKGDTMFFEPRRRGTKLSWKKQSETSLWDDDEEDIVIFGKKPNISSSPVSVMDFEKQLPPPMKPLPPVRKLEYTPSPPPINKTVDDKLESILAKEVGISQARLPLKPEGGRRDKAKTRSLMAKFWARKRQEKANAQAQHEEQVAKLEAGIDNEAEAEAEAEGEEPKPVRSHFKIREKARRADRRAARDAKCASWRDANEIDTVVFGPPPAEKKPETRFILIDRPVISVPVCPAADAVFEEVIAQDRVIAAPRIPIKIGGADEVGLHSRMARREKQKERALSKKHWMRFRAARRAARADHEARFAEAESEVGEPVEEEYWPAAPQYTKASLKARRSERRAARDAKCASWEHNEVETVVFAGRPKPVKVVKEARPWVSRAELPPSAETEPKFEELVTGEVQMAVDVRVHSHMAKREEKKGRELDKKMWARKRAAKAARAKCEASLLASNLAEEEAEEEAKDAECAPLLLRSSSKVREKARRAVRRGARGAKCAAWDDNDSAEHVVFGKKGWLEAVRPEKTIVRNVMYDEVGSPTSTLCCATRMASDEPRARVKLSFGETIRITPVSTIRKDHEKGLRAHRRNIVEATRIA